MNSPYAVVDLFQWAQEREERAENPLPPFVADSDTSLEAAESMRSAAPAIREVVFEQIRRNGRGGATCDELEVALGLAHQNCSARVNELMRSRRIVDSGLRRKTRSRRNAVVWVSISWVGVAP